MDDVDWAVALSEASGAVWLVLGHFQQQRSVWSIPTGNLLTLSEQQLVNCITVGSACNGKLMNNGFVFGRAKNAICTEANYSYTCPGNQGHLQGFELQRRARLGKCHRCKEALADGGSVEGVEK